MCTKEHWEKCKTSDAFYAANKFAIELEEYAKQNGYNNKGIKVRSKEQVIKSGLGKADALVIWEDGPKDWALEFAVETDRTVSRIAEASNAMSFYLL